MKHEREMPIVPKQHARHRWSSYRGNALGEPDLLLTPHPLCLGLGDHDDAASRPIGTCFRGVLDAKPLTDLCLAVDQDQPTGNDAVQHAACHVQNTSVVIDLDLIDPDLPPDECAIAAITLAELAAGLDARRGLGVRTGCNRLRRPGMSCRSTRLPHACTAAYSPPSAPLDEPVDPGWPTC